MKTLEVIMCQGVPASGKSTWARQFAEEKGFDKWVIINRDSIRNSLGDYWVPNREDLVTDIELSSFRSALDKGFNVILDSTNLNPKTIQKFKEIVFDFLIKNADKLNINFNYKLFEISFEEACKRDEQRSNPVGKKVIKSFFYKYFPDFEKKTDPRIKQKTITSDSSLPDCIICDIDGTISLMDGRNPYKGEDCNTDKPNDSVIKILQVFNRYNKAHDNNFPIEKTKIILFSGRNGESWQQTYDWLNANFVPYDELYMREEGNNEKDDLLKKRFYNNYVKGKYNVLFWLDDRNQVVDMVRNQLNLPCFQVYYGDF
jgi:predicted kinase